MNNVTQLPETKDFTRENEVLEARCMTQFLGNVLTSGQRLDLNENEMAGLGLIFQQIDQRLEG